jgi:hypothetical protein
VPEWQGSVEGLAPSKMKEEIINSLSADTVGVPATFRSSVPTKQEKWQSSYRLLETSSLKEGAMWHD